MYKMKRLLFEKLCAWKASARRKPLVLRGVRQTGKTYLLEHFGAQAFRRYHIVNFEKQKAMASLFARDLDPHRIINELALALHADIDIQQDLVIFDEIQACPEALTSLKYFCESLPELALCSAGSLLGLKLSEGSYPVGKVDMMHLSPMTFIEFLAGTGHEKLSDYLAELHVGDEIPDIIHQQCWALFKIYLIVGGLPEVVSVYREHQDNQFMAFSAVRKKQEELINAYYADIAKHAGKVNAMHIDRVWRSVPVQLSKTLSGQAERYRFKGVIPSINRYSRLVNVFDWLDSAELVQQVRVVETVQSPLKAYAKDSAFKCFMFDVGVLGAMSGLDPSDIFNYDYGTYKGYFAENFVLQAISSMTEKSLYNWQENRSEVEFLFSHQGEIIPLEVKSGAVVKAQSLKKFDERYKPTCKVIFSARNLRTEQKDRLIQIPLYMAERLIALIDSFGSDVE